MCSIYGRFRRKNVRFIVILMCSIFGRFRRKNEVFSFMLMCSIYGRFWQKMYSSLWCWCVQFLGDFDEKMKCSVLFSCVHVWRFRRKNEVLILLLVRVRPKTYPAFLSFWMLLVRQYSDFLDFAYPELAACSKPHYTAVEGYDRHLKVFVPFFATVYNTVYGLLVEVLEKDASRFHSCIPSMSSLKVNYSWGWDRCLLHSSAMSCSI